MKKPVIGITMGDAAGIGPEIIVKALSEPEIYQICDPLVIGDGKILERAAQITRAGIKIQPVPSMEKAVFKPGKIACLHLDLLPQDLPFGQVSAAAGDAAYRFVEKAVRLCLAKELDAVCTTPLNKEALQMGGHAYPGHTEILATLTGTREYAMMFSSPQLNVILVTTHIGLVDAIAAITPERVLATIRLGELGMRQLGTPSPRIAICAINPHAGEGGLFGHGEEQEKILPAILQAQKENHLVSSPLPADTAFHRAVQGNFDLVVAMYHDQGLIPIKTLAMSSAVNITVGLPIIRTSVDHGTAFDIAGKGIADATNLLYAIKKAVQMVNFKNNQK